MLDLGFRDDLEFILETDAAGAPHPAVLGDLPRRHRGSSRRRYQRDALAHRSWRRRRRPWRHRLPRHPRRAARSRARGRQRAALLRIAGGAGVLQHPRRRAPSEAILLERGFSAVALSGELEPERAQRGAAGAARRPGAGLRRDRRRRARHRPAGPRPRRSMPTCRNDAEVLQHRSGRTGRAGNKGVSVLLVPPRRRQEASRGVLLNWRASRPTGAPRPPRRKSASSTRSGCSTIRCSPKRTRRRIWCWRRLLADRSPEAIAAALMRLYRSRLPSPEDILDPGHGAGRSRDVGSRDKGARPPRGEDRDYAPRAKPGKSSPRHGGMAEGSVGFAPPSAAARRRSPLAATDDLRRGGVDKHDIGAIKIMDTTTEFEISKGRRSLSPP